jgi:multiple sugar transport system ATP-binding protein
MIAGLEIISHGEMKLNGKIVNDTPSRERGVAMVFQSYALYPHKTVRQNLEFSLKLEKLPPDQIESRVNKAVNLLQIEPYLDRKPAQLSGGQRQRVAMGRAIVREPKVFLFDEPLSNLDAKLRNQMRIEIKKLQRRLQVTTIYVTHDQVEAMTLADVIVVMRDGVIEQSGTSLVEVLPCRVVLPISLAMGSKFRFSSHVFTINSEMGKSSLLASGPRT